MPLADLQDEFALTHVFIAHDLGVVRHVSTRIAVMYLREVVETAAADPLYSRPGHPYTEALLSASPDVEDEGVAPRERILLTGDVPNPVNKPSGCPSAPAVPTPRTSAPRSTRRCEMSPPAGMSPAISRCSHRPVT